MDLSRFGTFGIEPESGGEQRVGWVNAWLIMYVNECLVLLGYGRQQRAAGTS